MKRYKVIVNEIKTNIFELNAISKEEAKAMVDEIIYKTKILNLNCVSNSKKIEYKIARTKGDLLNEKGN